MDKIGMLVVSPGVPSDLPVVQNMEKAGIPVWGEVELASTLEGEMYWRLPERMEKRRRQHSLERL